MTVSLFLLFFLCSVVLFFSFAVAPHTVATWAPPTVGGSASASVLAVACASGRLDERERPARGRVVLHANKTGRRSTASPDDAHRQRSAKGEQKHGRDARINQSTVHGWARRNLAVWAQSHTPKRTRTGGCTGCAPSGAATRVTHETSAPVLDSATKRT